MVSPTAAMQPANNVAGIMGASLTIVATAMMLRAYFRYGEMQVSFNRLQCMLCVGQLVLAVNVFIGSSIALSGNMTPRLCNGNGAVDIVSDMFALMSSIGFFVSVSRLRAGKPMNVGNWALLSGFVAALDFSATMGVLVGSAQPAARDSRVFFAMDLAWCSLPHTSDITSLSIMEVSALHLLSCFALGIILVFVAVLAYVNFRFVESGSDWGSKRNIHLRFWGTAAFPVIIYTFGATARFAYIRSHPPPAFGLIVSFLYPLWGFLNSVLFLSTEGLLLPSIQFWKPLPETLPGNGFAAVITAVTCSLLVGDKVPSSASIQDNMLEDPLRYDLGADGVSSVFGDTTSLPSSPGSSRSLRYASKTSSGLGQTTRTSLAFSDNSRYDAI